MAHPLPLAPGVNNEIQIFLNSSAGRGAASEKPALEEAFASAGARASIAVVDGPQLADAIRARAADGARVIGVAGGDGTISTAANAIAHTESVLLPIPLGTLNHFAQRYGLASIDAAVHAWSRSSPKPVHVGVVNDRIFVNNASCGFYPHMVRHRERLERVLPRKAAMWLAGSRVLFELPLMRLTVRTPTEVRELRTPALWVGIGRNSLRLPLPGDTEIEERVLEVVSGRADTRRRVVSLAFRLFRHLKKGLEPREEHLDVLRAKDFILHSERPVDVALDGEPFLMRTPLEFAIRENALRILCLVAPAV